MVNYVIVGLGLAGISFCETLEQNNKTFKVIADSSQTSSVVAGGLYNPVILKRFTLAWNAKHQLDIALPFYKTLEKKLQVQLDYKIPVLRRFASVEEQNMWFEAMDKPSLSYFLSPKIIQNKNANIDANFGYGEVLHTGRIDTKELLSTYKNYLISKNALLQETFNFNALTIEDDCINYKGIKAEKIIFATGFGLKNNPYFNYLPLNGTKGELLTIKAPDLKEERVIKSSVFIIPMGNNLYRIGATYNRDDKTNNTSQAAKEELLTKLHTFLKCNYEVVDHKAGVRPTVADRKPLVGEHPKHKNIFVLNGFGSRGVMAGPYAAQQLYNFIENNKPLAAEIDCKRFVKRYLTSVS
ncbi:FAD-binding oxidoreductase [Cellulophaga lytica]|uniref:NAD(P)/FAD-dependent oxidoreductase n=1 Tax=Cellulophaga TaxID=104264 RepID=UPI0004F7126D|nr:MULTISPECIES: FAD-binding oxidoreductase [Cellulophaga]AIM59640.1 FAD-dependent oxidoreductase [Cellulophaga lytica]APU09499.1 FAD-dependent oxidoreductase [Cellulophaga lytica]MDO6853890.1 FAD-binding oxidoreductase [Cellulophaga lytica]TVZ08846.1 glycine/D-amino acid oxidase-like deaminating enzyme [Cellulophaga sp. RHA_52]